MNAESEILATIFKRYDLISGGTPEQYEAIIDPVRYTRFDDWEPLTLQGSEYIRREAEASRVIGRFQYQIFNPQIQVRGDTAIALYYLHYWGEIRTRPFDIWSRVTTVLVRDGGWKIWHEHLSRLPGRPFAVLEEAPRAEVAGAPQVVSGRASPTLDPLSRAILEVLADGIERDPVNLALGLHEKLGRYVDSAEVSKRCQELERMGLLEREGPEGLLARYRLKRAN